MAYGVAVQRGIVTDWWFSLVGSSEMTGLVQVEGSRKVR